MKKILLLISSFFVLGFNASAQSKAPAAAQVWKTYSKDNFSVKYPAGWTVDASGSYSTVFFLFSPLQGKDDGFKENVNLVVQDLSQQPVTLDEFSAISVDQVKTAIGNTHLIENKKLKNQNGEYGVLIYTGEQQSFHLKFQQHFWVIGKKAYILSFIAEEKNAALYAKAVDAIFKSFTIKK